MNLENLKDIENLPLSLTVDQVAHILGIGKHNAYNLCHSKDFPAIQVGKRIVIPKLGFIEWMKNPKSKE